MSKIEVIEYLDGYNPFTGIWLESWAWPGIQWYVLSGPDKPDRAFARVEFAPEENLFHWMARGKDDIMVLAEGTALTLEEAEKMATAHLPKRENRHG